MSRSKVPPSVKSPFSLEADYADPQLYGWAGILFGALALVVGVPMLFMLPATLYGGVAVILSLGAVLVLAGVWMVRREE
ncbi:MAG TPA: hypothetical protein VMY17_02645 [Thermoplasmata archaeon]|jgi:hypothetical protein|nr:hypothetical protein [Thermoplasmata archaeon]